MEIKKVVVIGSGTMGSGIAAHLCNANVPVTLLDLTTDISTKARERIHKSRPPLLIDKSKIDNIKVGNINDDFNVVTISGTLGAAPAHPIVHAIKMLVAHYYENRRAVITASANEMPLGVAALLNPYRIITTK